MIVLDDELVGGAPLLEFLRQLNESAPVVLIASYGRQNEIAKMVVAGKVEFVGRHGDYAALAAHPGFAAFEQVRPGELRDLRRGRRCPTRSLRFSGTTSTTR